VLAVDKESEDKMGAGALIIVVGDSDRPIHAGFLQVLEDLVLVLYFLHGLLTHCLPLGILSYLYQLSWLLSFLGQEIPKVLIVDFDETCLDLIFHNFLALVDFFEDLIHSREVKPWVLISANHGVGLPRASLPIGHDADIVPIKRRSNQLLDFLRDFSLGLMRLKDLIKVKSLLFVLLAVAYAQGVRV